MQCISSITLSVRINEQPHGCITPSRGLLQGDPLFPYLFLVCVEGLSALIKKVASNGVIEGVKVCCHGPSLSHLFFANNSLIFC